MIKIYAARWVLPITSGVIEDGGVAVSGTRIVGVGARAELASKFDGAAVEDFGEAALLPGLVNCHSHLELTAMRGYLEREEGDFFAWLKKLTIARELRMTADDIRASATWGVVEAVRAGVTAFGDASSAGAAPLQALREVGARGIVFQESFGPDPSAARTQFEKLKDDVARLLETNSDGTSARSGDEIDNGGEVSNGGDDHKLVNIGVSPHAPYTVSAPLLELITAYALSERLPLMMHAAESRAETLLLREGRGPFADGLRARGIEWRAPGLSTIQYLSSLGFLRARPLLAHCIDADEADIALVKESRARVAHCPKSNAKLGHGRAPFAAFVRAGLDAGLGSDSVASNNTCDLLEEARFAALLSRSAGDARDDERMLTADDALRAATAGGARALGLEHKIGALAEGFEADLIAVNLAGAHQQPVHDPAAALVFASSGRDVLMTMVAGRELFRDGHVMTVDEDDLRARVSRIARALGGDG